MHELVEQKRLNLVRYGCLAVEGAGVRLRWAVVQPVACDQARHDTC